MKNWDAFTLISTCIIALALFSSDKIGLENMLDSLNPQETLVVIVKTMAVVFLGSAALALMVLLVLVDIIVTLVSGIEFPILHFFYDVGYVNYFLKGYWDMHSGSHIFMACIILFGVALINTYMGPVYRKKTFVYHKAKQNNYSSH